MRNFRHPCQHGLIKIKSQPLLVIVKLVSSCADPFHKKSKKNLYCFFVNLIKQFCYKFLKKCYYHRVIAQRKTGL